MPQIAGLETASPAVVLAGVVPELITFAQHLDVIHQVMFGSPLVITSGKDSIHAAASLHAIGSALDVRIKDLAADAQLAFLLILSYAAPANQIAVFDERALGDESHVHLEYHGS